VGVKKAECGLICELHRTQKPQIIFFRFDRFRVLKAVEKPTFNVDRMLKTREETHIGVENS